MIRLNNNPYENTNLSLNIQFKDSFGVYYIPSVASYTVLALNDDGESWEVVDELYKVPIESASTVNLIIPKVRKIDGCKNNRKVLIEWEAFLNNEYCSFIDEVDFDVKPLPFINNPPTSIPIPRFVKLDVSLQSGTFSHTPVLPVFEIVTDVPVVLHNAEIYISQGDIIIGCDIGMNNIGTKITVSPTRYLLPNQYMLVVRGIEAIGGVYGLEEPIELGFTVQDLPKTRWGEIEGNIENQTDLLEVVKDYVQRENFKHTDLGSGLFEIVARNEVDFCKFMMFVDESGGYKIIDFGGTHRENLFASVDGIVTANENVLVWVKIVF